MWHTVSGTVWLSPSRAPITPSQPSSSSHSLSFFLSFSLSFSFYPHSSSLSLPTSVSLSLSFSFFSFFLVSISFIAGRKTTTLLSYRDKCLCRLFLDFVTIAFKKRRARDKNKNRKRASEWPSISFGTFKGGAGGAQFSLTANFCPPIVTICHAGAAHQHPADHWSLGSRSCVH